MKKMMTTTTISKIKKFMSPEKKLAEEAILVLIPRQKPLQQQILQTLGSPKKALVENGFRIKSERSLKEKYPWKRVRLVKTVEQLFYKRSSPRKNLSFPQRVLHLEL